MVQIFKNKSMQVNAKQINLTKEHLELLQYTDNLFARWSLRKNSYLFKHLKSNLQIPLYIIAEERRISQITQNQATLIQALKLSQYAEVNQQSRMVKILELPCVRVADQANLVRVENVVKNYIKQKAGQDKINSTKPIQYVVSGKTDDGYYYIVIKLKEENDKSILKNLIQKSNKQQAKQKIKYSEQSMYEDIKDGVNKFRKSKRQYLQNNQPNQQKYSKNNYYNNNNNYETGLSNPVYLKQNMMMMYPGVYYPTQWNYDANGDQMYYPIQQQKVYHTFIRKAVNSDSEQDQIVEDIKKKKYEEKFVQKQQQQKSQEQTQQIKIQKVEEQRQEQLRNSKQVKQNEQKSKHIQNGNKSPINQNSNNTNNTNNNDSPHNNKKSDHKNNKNKKHNNNHNNSNNNQKQKQKQQKVKVVLDDSDFPSIG